MSEPIKRIKAAKIVAAHGLRGQVKLKPYMPLESGVFHGASGAEYKITIKNQAGDVFIAEVEGAADRDAAERLKGKELYVTEGALPALGKNEFYTDDLIGIAVKNEADETVGSVCAVHDFGAGDILEIRFTDEQMLMYPFRHAIFPEVNVDKKFIRFIPPEETE